MNQYNYYCTECNKITHWRYLNCDDCKESDITCIYICTECGVELGFEKDEESDDYVSRETIKKELPDLTLFGNI